MDDQATNPEGSGRLTIFWRGARRGLKFGAIACLVIWVVVNGVSWVGAMFLPSLREQLLNYLSKFGLLTVIAVLLLELVVLVPLFAIPSALFGGLVSLVRTRGATPIDSDTKSDPTA
jgi:hypothetical protein